MEKKIGACFFISLMTALHESRIWSFFECRRRLKLVMQSTEQISWWEHCVFLVVLKILVEYYHWIYFHCIPWFYFQLSQHWGSQSALFGRACAEHAQHLAQLVATNFMVVLAGLRSFSLILTQLSQIYLPITLKIKAASALITSYQCIKMNIVKRSWLVAIKYKTAPK